MKSTTHPYQKVCAPTHQIFWMKISWQIFNVENKQKAGLIGYPHQEI